MLSPQCGMQNKKLHIQINRDESPPCYHVSTIKMAWKKEGDIWIINFTDLLLRKN